jgi:hypothetical protein
MITMVIIATAVQPTGHQKSRASSVRRMGSRGRRRRQKAFQGMRHRLAHQHVGDLLVLQPVGDVVTKT